jgi:hypothetical protein
VHLSEEAVLVRISAFASAKCVKQLARPEAIECKELFTLYVNN